MIKIDYKGSQISFDSVTEAREFIDGNSIQFKVVKSRESGAANPLTGLKRPQWTAEEVQFIIDNVNKLSVSEIVSNPALKKHSIGSNIQMVGRVKNNPRFMQVPRFIKQMISEYHANK